ncbi:T9SS C-terminal target domain-containing protein, partial [candidate division KSB1 bacterium]
VQTIALSEVTYGGGGLAIEVATGTTLDFGVSELAGNGLFVLNEGATLATVHEGGIDSTIQTTGDVVLSNSANFIFNGTAAQVTNFLMPDTVNGLTIDNAAGVTLSKETLINGVLRLVAGEFDNTIPFALGPNGSISYEGGSLKYPLSVEDPLLPEIPTEFALLQNYPNPFNPSTTIRYDLPRETHVTLKIYDIMGHLVAELVNEKHEAGAYELVWNANGVASGVYFYQITAGDFTSVRKLILMK